MQRRIVIGRGQRVEVRDHVVALDNRIEQQDQVQQRLLQIEILGGEPFAAEHDDRPTETIDAALVQAADARHLRQVFGARPVQQFLVPAQFAGNAHEHMVRYR